MLSGNKIAAREKILAQRELAKAELGKLGEKTCLGNYTIGTTDLNQTVSLEDQVKTILGGPAQDRDPAWEAIWENRIKPALLGKTTVTTSTVARERFITLLQERLVELKDEKKCKLSMPQYKGDRSPLNTAAGEITMSALFGKKLEEAYLAAIKEEAATLEFRRLDKRNEIFYRTSIR